VDLIALTQQPSWSGAPRLTLIGSGALATDLTGVLRDAGLGPALRLNSGAATASAGQIVPHWSRFTGPWTGLVIVASHTAEPDRALTDHLARQRTPHLIVRVEASRAVVGPFVIPGVSACVRCHDLVRCEFDDAWPALLAQLSRARLDPPGHLRGWAVSTTLLQVRAQATGTVPDTLGRTLEVSWADPVIRTQTIPPHPECGCVAA